MIDMNAVLSAFAVLYAVTFVGLLAATRLVPPELRRYAYVLVGVVGLAGVNVAFQRFEIGAVTVERGRVFLSSVVTQTVGYVVLYGAVVRLAGASKRMTALVTGLALTPLYLSQFGTLLGFGEWFLYVTVAGFVVPYPAMLYLFLRPIWRSAKEQSPRRRLLHWKARNVLLFLYGWLLLYIGALLARLVTDTVVNQFLFQYETYFFFAGIPALLIYNFATLDRDRVGDLFGDVAGEGTTG